MKFDEARCLKSTNSKKSKAKRLQVSGLRIIINTQRANMGIVAGINEFKKQHPRRFVAALTACVIGPLLLLGGSSHEGQGFASRFSSSYAYPPLPAEYATNGIAIAPISIKAAAARAEQLWAKNVQKRDEFITWKGGKDSIRMFSPRGEPGWGQLYTIWVSLVRDSSYC